MFRFSFIKPMCVFHILYHVLAKTKMLIVQATKEIVFAGFKNLMALYNDKKKYMD